MDRDAAALAAALQRPRSPISACASSSLAGEELRTEISAKFTRRRLEADFDAAGLALERWYTDPQELFALSLARRADGAPAGSCQPSAADHGRALGRQHALARRRAQHGNGLSRLAMLSMGPAGGGVGPYVDSGFRGMQINDSGAKIPSPGGASGLGEATVRRLHSAGAHVVIADLNEERGSSLAGELGDRARFLRTDVTDPDTVKAAVDAAAEQPGGLRISVCCAGIAWGEKIAGNRGAHSLDAFETVIRVNLIGTFNVLRLAGQAMRAGEPTDSGERGVCVNTASAAAFDGQIGQVAYSASKGGLVAMTLPAARDLAGDGIRVCAIAPGIFETPLMAELSDETRESLGKSIPFPSRLGRPDEYAALATHIIENQMLNGEVIRLDGALRMAPR